MDLEKSIFIGIIVLGLLGIIILGIGITGKVVMNSYTLGDTCTSNKDCQNSKVCCISYNQNSGICQTRDMCETITKFTYENSNRIEAWNDFSKETPKKDNTYSLEIILGIIILIIVSASGYLAYKNTGKKIKKRKRRRK